MRAEISEPSSLRLVHSVHYFLWLFGGWTLPVCQAIHDDPSHREINNWFIKDPVQVYTENRCLAIKRADPNRLWATDRMD